jgi:hypothetical protein
LYEAGKELFGLTQKAAACECLALTVVIPLFAMDFSLPEPLFSPLWQNTPIAEHFNVCVESFDYRAQLYTTFEVPENVLAVDLEEQMEQPSGAALVIKVEKK